MRATWIVPIMFIALGTVGCAATAPTADDTIKFKGSDRAIALIEEQGKASAAIRGYSRETDLICERFHKTGSHITTNYCYTREERDRRQLNHEEVMRAMTNHSTCVPARSGPQGAAPGNGPVSTIGCVGD